MAQIVPFISTKGSVGKTALLIQIAGFIASRGKRALLIDADSQQSLSASFDYQLPANFAESSNDRSPMSWQDVLQAMQFDGFGKWLTGAATSRQVIRQTSVANIDIIANDDQEKWMVPRFLHSAAGAVFQLGVLIKQVKANYDYIFIDTEGTDGRDHDGRSVQNAALLAEPSQVISVTKTKIQFAMEVLRVVDVYNNALKEYAFVGKDCRPPLKFVLNEHDRSLNIAIEVLRELQEAFADNDRFACASLLQTVIPLKRKFFENFHRERIFAHQYRDSNQYDRINEVIPALAIEIFPELADTSLEPAEQQVNGG